jgi:hypothetical protein
MHGFGRSGNVESKELSVFFSERAFQIEKPPKAPEEGILKFSPSINRRQLFSSTLNEFVYAMEALDMVSFQ